jgi:predicted CXXCH cytochrome family protein
MTRDATAENVKGDFADAVYSYQDLTTRLSREGDSFFMVTVDPDWAALRARTGGRTDSLPPPRFVRLSVDRLVGSHWIQELLHRAPNGSYLRLPVLYHITERRWVHSNGAFLTPDTDDFWGGSRGTIWNQTCLFCHNTEPVQNPVRGPRGEVVGFRTSVTELGIACAACHGHGVQHVRLHEADKGRRAVEGDSSSDVVHPARLSIPRRDEICAHCHGALVPKADMWDMHTGHDPFVPGQELTRYNHFFHSEAEQAALSRTGRPPERPAPPEPSDGRFWSDGTPLTTALEYNGMALSACYQAGRGKLSCLSCHTMHRGDPNFLLRSGMETNEACYQCHAGYRARLAEHTRHPAGSPGSLCYNCHMPYQVYSLLTTHRSHRITVPDLASSLGTGKPHACNLCHLDRSLGWTAEQLALWPNGRRKPAPKLSADEQAVSAAVLALAQGDARSRVVVAGAFSSPAARLASGSDWFGPFLTRLLEQERYPAVRYLAHRGLRAAHGEAAAGPFDYLAGPPQRAAELRALRARFDAAPVRRKLPHLPLTPEGLPDEAALQRLRANRHDPDLRIHE